MQVYWDGHWDWLRPACWRFTAWRWRKTCRRNSWLPAKRPSRFRISRTINLATAQRIADACEKAATDQGVQISVTVLDKEGNQVYADRMDGQGYLNVITSDLKARTALLGREPSKNRMNRVIQNPGQEFSDIQRGLFPNSGGLPIVVNKQLIGAVGVGGSAPKPPVWSDEICAHKGAGGRDRAVGGAAGAGPSAAPESQSGQRAGCEVCHRDSAQVDAARGMGRRRQGSGEPF